MAVLSYRPNALDFSPITNAFTGIAENRRKRDAGQWVKNALLNDDMDLRNEATGQLLAHHPEVGVQVLKVQESRDKTKKEEAQNFITGALASIGKATPDQRPQMWQQGVSILKQRYPEFAQGVPDQYSDEAYGQVLLQGAQAGNKIFEKLAAQHFGIQAEGAVPSSIQEYQYAQKLTDPAERAAFEKYALAAQRGGRSGVLKGSPGDVFLNEHDLAAGEEPKPLYQVPWAPRPVAPGGTVLLDPNAQPGTTGQVLYQSGQGQSPAPAGVTPSAPIPQQLQEMTAAERAQAQGSRGNVPAEGLKLVQEAQDAMSGVQNAQMGIQKAAEALKNPAFELGPVQNLKYEAALKTGNSDRLPGAREYASLKTTLESMRNAILILHKGVQTEGDATRAMSQIINNLTDKQYVADRLAELEQLNQRAIQLQQSKIQGIYQNYGAPTPATAQPVAPPQAAPQAQPKVLTRAQAQALATKRGVPIDEVLQRAQRAGMQIQ